MCMAEKKKRTSIYIEGELVELGKVVAKAEDRSWNNWVQKLMLEAVKDFAAKHPEAFKVDKNNG
jgi:hypothetical protein